MHNAHKHQPIQIYIKLSQIVMYCLQIISYRFFRFPLNFAPIFRNRQKKNEQLPNQCQRKGKQSKIGRVNSPKKKIIFFFYSFCSRSISVVLSLFIWFYARFTFFLFHVFIVKQLYTLKNLNQCKIQIVKTVNRFIRNKI